MTDPTNKVPHLLGINLDGTGIATTRISALNRTTGDRQIKETDSTKVVVFDAGDFTDGYTNGDVIEFENSGASHGGTTITINTEGGFQNEEITCVAAPTGNISI